MGQFIWHIGDREVIMNNSKIKFVTRTAILLALTVVFQMAGRAIPNNNFIVGPLVNACLIISTAMVGIFGGLVIAVISPFTSLINNHAPIAGALLPFSPFVAAGNFVLVLSYYLLMKRSQIAGIIVGSILKSGFLYGGVILFLKIFSFPKFANTLMFLFGWPQLVTALIGGAVALIVIKSLGKAFDMDINRQA